MKGRIDRHHNTSDSPNPTPTGQDRGRRSPTNPESVDRSVRSNGGVQPHACPSPREATGLPPCLLSTNVAVPTSTVATQARDMGTAAIPLHPQPRVRLGSMSTPPNPASRLGKGQGHAHMHTCSQVEGAAVRPPAPNVQVTTLLLSGYIYISYTRSGCWAVGRRCRLDHPHQTHQSRSIRERPRPRRRRRHPRWRWRWRAAAAGCGAPP